MKKEELDDTITDEMLLESMRAIQEKRPSYELTCIRKEEYEQLQEELQRLRNTIHFISSASVGGGEYNITQFNTLNINMRLIHERCWEYWRGEDK